MPDSMATPSLSTDCSCAPGSISAVQTKPQRGGGSRCPAWGGACSRNGKPGFLFCRGPPPPRGRLQVPPRPGQSSKGSDSTQSESQFVGRPSAHPGPRSPRPRSGVRDGDTDRRVTSHSECENGFFFGAQIFSLDDEASSHQSSRFTRHTAHGSHRMSQAARVPTRRKDPAHQAIYRVKLKANAGRY